MDMDGKTLWTCRNGHVLGVVSRVQVKREVPGVGMVVYKTSALRLFREAQAADGVVRDDLDVAGMVYGRMLLKFTWSCSMPGCHALREWKPDEEAINWLRERYGQKGGA